jgi:hypothetical protein
MFRSGLVIGVMLAGVSCGSKDAVSVSGTLANPQVLVAQAPGGLVSNLSGSFDVALELGARASDPESVEFVVFNLVRADNELPVLGAPQGKPLSWTASSPLPVVLYPGDKKTVAVTIGTGTAAMEVPAADKQAVCLAGQLRLVGTIQGTGGGWSQPISSMAFLPSGC